MLKQKGDLVSSFAVAGIPLRSPPGPTRTPACTGKRPVSRGDAMINIDGDSYFIFFRCASSHTINSPLQRLLSNHTHSSREPGEVKGRGGTDYKGEAAVPSKYTQTQQSMLFQCNRVSNSGKEAGTGDRFTL